MANYTPITGSAKQPPNPPFLRDMQPGGSEGSFFAWDRVSGFMWIWTKVRRRSYICSRGMEHRRYWRTHWEQGAYDYVACDHEVQVEVADKTVLAYLAER